MSERDLTKRLRRAVKGKSVLQYSVVPLQLNKLAILQRTI